jgi:YjbE family integral membrane protein
MHLDTTAFVFSLLQIIWIDILLSGDNAVVIALACRSLPPQRRRWGIILGAGAAVLLRILFAFFVVELLLLPNVRIIGGLLLLLIAIRLVDDEESGPREVKPAKTLWASIRMIVLADAIMSLDNVVAIAAAAKGSILLVAFGLVLSIPLIVFSSTFMLSLLNRFPLIVWAGAALLGWIGAELICHDPYLFTWLQAHAPGFEILCAAAGAVLVLAAAWTRQRLRPRYE